MRVGNRPTLNFSSMVEDVVKVGNTWYSAYTRNVTGNRTVRLASTTDLWGAWTDLGAILTLGSQSWENTAQGVNGCCLMENGGTFYLFYDSEPNGAPGETADIGYATAGTVTGPYTKYASNPVFTRGGSGAWDELRVQEPSVIVVDGAWVMAYMGEAPGSTGLTEQIGIATASGPAGPWTKAGTDGLILARRSGFILADPALFYESGRYWCYYVEADATAVFVDSTPYYQLLAWADTPAGPWTKLGQPLMGPDTAGPGAIDFESGGPWRGGLFKDGDDYWVTYAAMATPADVDFAKGSTGKLTIWTP